MNAPQKGYNHVRANKPLANIYTLFVISMYWNLAIDIAKNCAQNAHRITNR